MPPTIVFIPGLWETPAVFTSVISFLHSKGFETLTVSLPSTGTSSPGNPSMHDDERAIRTIVQRLVEKEEKEVLMVCHSAGGFLGSAAIEGLSKKSIKEKEKVGGVVGIVFLSAGIVDVGYQHVTMPFMEFDREKGIMTCVSPSTTLFDDLPPALQAQWLPVLQHQPSFGWDSVTEYVGWKEVSSTYLICETDKCLPKEVQEHMAALAGSKVERCGAGHMVMLGMPERVVEVILGALKKN